MRPLQPLVRGRDPERACFISAGDSLRPVRHFGHNRAMTSRRSGFALSASSMVRWVSMTLSPAKMAQGISRKLYVRLQDLTLYMTLYMLYIVYVQNR